VRMRWSTKDISGSNHHKNDAPSELSASFSSDDLRQPQRRRKSVQQTLEASIREEMTDPYRNIGVATFNFGIFPEGEDMVRYNKEHPKAHPSLFTSEEVWSMELWFRARSCTGRIRHQDSSG
jgi:hypothetical protein